MHMHVVLYQCNPKNPQAVVQIMDKVLELLVPLAQELKGTIFNAAPIPVPVRAAAITEYHVMLNFIFPDEATYHQYMGHPLHLKFAKFVLRGWMLVGDSGEGAEDRFIDHFLHATVEDPPIGQVRNPLVLESEVVWQDELTVDA